MIDSQGSNWSVDGAVYRIFGYCGHVTPEGMWTITDPRGETVTASPTPITGEDLIRVIVDANGTCEQAHYCIGLSPVAMLMMLLDKSLLDRSRLIEAEETNGKIIIQDLCWLSSRYGTRVVVLRDPVPEMASYGKNMRIR
jgi:hypothetical protein